MRAQILDEAVQGAINGTIPWNDSPLAMSDELREVDDEVQHETDRALAVAAQLRYHQPDPDLVGQTLDEQQRWSTSGNGSPDDPVNLPPTWVNIGPTDARFEVNGGVYFQNDSGRATFIRTDPRFNGQGPLTLYHATATGGIWKTYDALADSPTWIPIGDTINGSTAAFDIDTSHPDTLYAATGDAFDTTQGGQILKSTAGGGSWTVVTSQLVGTYDHLPSPVGNRTETGVQVRDLRVDPNDSNRVLVATEVGLFLSTDAGAHFNLVQFPTFPNNLPDREANAWSIAYVGRGTDGKTHWLVSGQPACGTPQFPFPPRRGFYGMAVGSDGCPDGNRGDIWKSTDGGTSWRSLRAAGRFDYGADQHYIVELWTDVGRMTLATGTTVDPTHTVIYAWAEPNRELGPQQQPGLLAILKSVDGGEHFTSVARGDTAIGYRTTGGDCPNLDVGKGQAWYNQAIAVDPLNSNNVLIGGQLCGARSRDGGRSWENVSHWLPHAGGGISGGTLKYVHADWHAGLIVRVASETGTTPVAFAGTDGGNFRATNLFDVDHPKDINWKSNNKGITSHQFYSLASGDPVAGDAYVAFGGLQDNGTRIRDDAPDAGTTVFNQVVGGDGVANTLARVTDTAPPTDRRLFFTALPGSRAVCRTPATTDACNAQSGAWTSVAVGGSTGDSEPFFIRYALLPRATPTGSDQAITITTFNIHRIYYRAGQTPFTGSVRLTTWTNPTDPSNSFFIDGISQGVRNIHTSPTIYSDDQGSFRLIGASLGNGWFSVGKDRSTSDTTVNITWTNSTTRLGIGGSGTGQTLSGTTSVTFPYNAHNIAASQDDGDVYVVTTNAAKMRDNVHPVPANIGHIFMTTDRGATWTAIHGNGTGFDLPNVPAEQAVFDPGDHNDRTIYALLDTGPYVTRDRGLTWSRLGVGAPYAQADMMFISSSGDLVRIGFYSRGIWEIYPNSQARGVPGNGDWDRNLQIDFLDLGALASRLGTTPATTAAPLFDWNLAMGDANAIQESDLVTLLNKFGKHP
jgi:hypothetical protein